MNEEVFISHPTLEVGHCTLKALSFFDLKEIEELCSYYPPERRISASALLEKIEKEYQAKNGINWGIYSNSKLIGTVGFYRGFENNEGELGYVIREKYRGLGIGKTCAKFLVDFALKKMELSAIEAYTDKENIASQRLLRAIGFDRIEHKDTNTAAFRIES